MSFYESFKRPRGEATQWDNFKVGVILPVLILVVLPLLTSFVEVLAGPQECRDFRSPTAFIETLSRTSEECANLVKK